MPNDFISRATVLSDIEQTIENSGCVNHEREIIDCVRYADAADVAPVVRCKDCKHYSPHPTDAEYGGKGWCRKLRGEAKQDFFCAAGTHEDGGDHHAD